MGLLWTLTLRSIGLAAAVTVVALILGVWVAVAIQSLSPRWRWLGYGLAVVCFLVPPFWVTDCWMWLLGQRGILHSLIPWNIYSFPGAVWVLALLYWPVGAAGFWVGWSRIRREEWEAVPNLRGWAAWRYLLWPAARSTVGVAGFVVFILALNQFSVPSFLQVRVLPVEVWLQFNTNYDAVAALERTFPLILVSLLVVGLLLRMDVSWPQAHKADWSRLFRERLGWSRRLIALLGWTILGIAVLPQLLGMGTILTKPQALIGAIQAGKGAILASFLFAFGGATLAILLGSLFCRWRWGVVTVIALILPGIFLSLGLMAIFQRPGWVRILRSPIMSMVVLGVRYMILGYAAVRLGRSLLDRSLLDVADWLGAGRSWRLWHLWRPQVGSLLFGAWLLAYLLCLWDVESLLLIIPPGWETVAHRIFVLLHYGHDEQVAALAFVLLVLGGLPWGLWWVGRRLVCWMRCKRERREANGLSTAVAALALMGLVGCTQQPLEEGKPLVEPILQSRFFDRVKVIGGFGRGAGRFIKPRSLAVDQKGNLYVVDFSGRLQKFDLQGRWIWSYQFQEIQRGKPKGMTVDQKGRIVVAEPHYARINVFSPDGQLLCQWGRRGTQPGELCFPRDVAVNEANEIFVSEYGPVDRVQRFGPDGKKVICVFGHHGSAPDEMNRPEGLAIGPDGLLYVADSCNHRIQVWTQDGRLVRVFGRPGNGLGELSYPYDVAVDAEGNVFVCEFGNSRIQVFRSDGTPLEILGRPGSRVGQFSNPWSLALDRWGNVYVADAMNHRVQVLLRKGFQMHAEQGLGRFPKG